MDETEGTSIPDPRARRKERQAARQQGKSAAGGDKDAPPITEAAVLGLPEPAQVAPRLHLMLRAPVIRRSSALYARVMATWPDVMIYDALITRKQGSGLDAARAAEAARKIGTERLKNLESLDESERGENWAGSVEACRSLISYTEEDAHDALSGISQLLRGYDPEAEAARREQEKGDYTPHLLDGICDVVAELAIPWTDGMTRDCLPEALTGSLRAGEFCDLLRAVLRACDGSDVEFTDSLHQRFTKPLS